MPCSAELLPLHRRLLSCCLQLLTLLLASDAAATHLDAFAQLPPLLERLEAITSLGHVSSARSARLRATAHWCPRVVRVHWP